MATLGDLVINLTANTGGLTAGFMNAKKNVSEFTGTVSASLAKFGLVAAGFQAVQGAVQSVANVLTKPIVAAAQFEQTTVAFEVLLGSAEAAHQVLADLTNFAAKTPFQMPELEGATKQLLAYGFAQEELLPTLRMLGDVSSGLNVPIGELAFLFGTAKVEGRAFAKDIRQLTNRGVPIMAELAKQFGVSESEVSALVSAGKVGFPQIQKAFESLSGEGGRFENMMERQSKTLGGLWSTLQDEIGFAMRNIGMALVESLDIKSMVSMVISFASSFKDTFLPTIVSVIQTLVTFFTSDTVVAIGKFVAITGGAALAIAGLAATATTVAPIIGAAFTVAMGPVGLIIAAVVGLGAAIVQVTGEGETFGQKLSSTFSQIPALIDTLAFTFRNFGAIAQIALIDIVQKGLQLFPQLEGPIQNIAAMFIGVFAGVKSFFSAFIANVIGGLKEVGNVISALGAGAAAAFDAITSGNFSGAAQAFADAFTRELASQADIAGGGNPFAKFGEAFDKASQATLDMFTERGGLSNVLQEERQALLDSIAQRELERVQETPKPAVEEEKRQKEEEEERAKAEPPKFAAALEAGSKEAFNAILASMGRGGQQDPAKKTAEHTKTMAQRIAELVEIGKKTLDATENEGVVPSFT